MRTSKSILKPSALALLIACSFSAHTMASQQVSGTVLDAEGEPVKNARIHVHGRQQYIYTDANGRFQLNAPANAELHVSAPGFDGQYLQVTDPNSALAITLQPGGQIERIIVSASGIHKYNLEMATPVTVLSGEQLSRRAEPTIGETLKKQPGVHANYFGPVASSPVIRGLDGPRVRILNNGLDTGDVSRIGPDHAIMADALTTEQIEVLRGPATLLYGSGAIGGVVNVVDNRIPRQLRPQSDTVVETRYNTVSDEKTVALNHDGSHNQIAWHLDGLHRNADDYKVPHFTNSDGDHEDKIDNSWLETSSINAGLSYIGSRGLIGFHAGRTESEYGIPGHDHAHGHDDHDDHDHGHDHGHSDSHGHDDDVFAKARQNRFNLAGEIYDPFAGIETISLNLGYTDYEHREIEDGHVATFFGSKTLESRITLEHQPLAGWHGIFGYHLMRNDYTAAGEEAFTPDTETTSHALFVLEEKRFGDLTAQFGGRLERVKYHADGIEFGHHDHDHSHGHDHGHSDHDDHEHVEASFTAYSLSAGLVWEFQPGFSWAIAASRSERAPSSAELYSNGAHIATGTYELGLAYLLDHHDGDIEPNRDRFRKEIANNFDLTFRKFDGNLSLTYNFFYNRVNNYIYLANTGLDIDDLGGHGGHDDHDHDHWHDHGHDDHSDHSSFPVLQYRQDNAVLYGFEFELGYYLDQAQSVHVFADQVRAKVRGGDDLPRIPPMKLGAEYRYQAQNWSGEVGLTRYARQNRVSPLESRTGGYTLLDATFSYFFDLSDVEMTAFVRGTNLTNRLGFVHSSFIKEDAPLPGRAITVGLRARF